jgi:hypothetical protein
MDRPALADSLAATLVAVTGSLAMTDVERNRRAAKLNLRARNGAGLRSIDGTQPMMEVRKFSAAKNGQATVESRRPCQSKRGSHKTQYER